MNAKNPGVDAFIAKEKTWQAEFKSLREICLDCGMDEQVKWGKPCYSFQGDNIVIIQGFKAYCALLFVKGALLNDPERLLIQQTENVQAARQLRFTDETQIVELEPVIKAFIREATAAQKAGLEIRYKETGAFGVAPEFQEKLDELLQLRTAFEALTPGRQRGYLLYFSGAKQSQTRAARVEKVIPQILAGKGLND